MRFDGVTCCIQNNAASLFLSGRKSEDGTLTLWSGQFGANRYDNDATEIYTYDLNFTGSSAGADFDRLALQADAVPEPATWAMMIGGFGLAGAAVRRRSRRTGMGVAV